MKLLALALTLFSFTWGSRPALADHRAELLAASEELAEASEHLNEKLLVTPGYRNTQIAVEDMAEAAHHFSEQVTASTDLNHVRADYRAFYESYKNVRHTLHIDYTNTRNDHVMNDWLDISHTFRTVREIMRNYGI